MSEVKSPIRLAKAAKELNVGTSTIIDHLKAKGYDVENKPTTKLSEEMYEVLLKDFREDIAKREEADQVDLGGPKRENVEIKDSSTIPPPKKEEDSREVFITSRTSAPIGKEEEEEEKKKPETEPVKRDKLSGPKVVGKVDLAEKKKKAEEKKEEEVVEKKAEEPKEEPKEEQKPAKEKQEEPPQEVEKTKLEKLQGPTVIGKIDLPAKEEKKKKEKKEERPTERRKRKRRRIAKTDKIELKGDRKDGAKGRDKGRKDEDTEVSEKEIQEKIKATMAKISGTSKGKSSRSKHRRTKREEAAEKASEVTEQSNKLQVTEFISVSELASLMNVSPTEVISKCMGLGIIVSINQRLDAEVIELVADEFGFEVSFIEVTDQEVEIEEEEDQPEDLKERAPIVTIMGHVDHGKTSLLDHIRKENVVAGEKGGITQHIGAYEVTTDSGKNITFLDTPGHEAFTAMRARGAKITDIAVIVIAADDQVMPQTKEAISHAQAAGVPMIFAFNKIDKEGANADKIREQLSGMNLLVEDWGGKYQAQEISAKSGVGISDLLEKILLESELLELKANPDKRASGSVLEASLDKGRGYVATVLVQEGVLEVGDVVLAGPYTGRVKAMFNERNQRIEKAGPSQPALVLGLNGAPQAGELLKSLESEQEAKSVANKRMQIMREQGIRTKKHITLDEIGRRLALGTFKELNLIIKADFDGSVEAISDSLQKLSTEEVQVSIVHKGVGQITESDVLLASASDAIIIGFQVRPSVSARRLAEGENIDIRLYSVIYDAIDEVKSAMEGMLEPKIEEKITGNIEVRETFKITKVGTIAGCYVVDGKVNRTHKVRVIRDGIVVYSGELASLKRYKDDVKEVVNGQECGLNIKDYNDIKVGDIIEAYEQVEVKRKL